MTLSEQKSLCIELYTEGEHTIKEILDKTGLKYAVELYKVLDEAGIPRKNKRSSETTIEQEQKISIEDSRIRYLVGRCRLFKGEQENPYSEAEEPFKHYMWRNERKILENAQEEEFIERYNLNNPLSWGNYFDSAIQAYIKHWTNPENNETPRQWYSKYCEIKR